MLRLSDVTADCLKPIRLIATDMDGTLTQAGKFTPALLDTLLNLATAGIQVLIITGRSAGWVSGLRAYLPVSGAIAENGGLFYPGNSDSEVLLTSIGDCQPHRHRLAEVFQKLQQRFPDLVESSDNRFRVTDWTFDVQGLSSVDLHQLQADCRTLGWGFTYSTVQCHIKPYLQDKATGLLRVLQQYYPDYSLDQVLTVGDSPNDESLFDGAKFPVSVGVANVLHYTEQLNYRPMYVTTLPERAGFCELATALLRINQ